PRLDGGRMAQRYRVIVIGCGAIGAATAYWLSRRLDGDAVLALEQYELGHGRGASEDHSRVIRHAYSRPDYTALTPAAYQSWNVAERESGLRLVHRTGGLVIAERGRPAMEYVEDAAAALLYYGVPVYGEVAVKAGLDGAGPVVTPQTRTSVPDPQRVAQVRAFLERYLPGALGPELYTRVCCYDFPPDRDFIADYVPGSARVLVCVGAGHAGKFAALLGRILTELTIA